jgi:hypothetical protein
MSKGFILSCDAEHQAFNLTPVCNAGKEEDAGEIFLIWQSSFA